MNEARDSTRKPRLGGVSVGQYAAVVAALGEGHALPAVLEVEGLTETAWREAEAAWSEGVASDPETATLFRVALEEAEDHLTRRVEPIDYDVAAWLSFFRAWCMAPAPPEFLERNALRPSDISRLQRLWARRMGQDAALQRRVAELAMTSLPAPAPLQVELARLRASPASSAPGAAAQAPAKDPAADLDLAQYAAICAEIADAPALAADVLARFGLPSKPNWDEAWRSRLAADDALGKDFRVLVAHYRSRVGHAKAGALSAAVAETSAPSQPVSGRAALRATVRAGDDAPIRSALPFKRDVTVAIDVVAERAETLRSRNLPEGSVKGTLDVEKRSKKSPTLPFLMPEPPASRPPEPEQALLSLEQHASLCVELALQPDRTVAILLRYQITQDHKARADAYWRERARAEPDVEAAWARAFETYRKWFLSQTSV
jgi:hypothetical protein